MLSWTEIESRAIAFQRRWKGCDGDEKQHAQTFEKDFMQVFGVDWRDGLHEHEITYPDGTRGYVDYFLPGAAALHPEGREGLHAGGQHPSQIGLKRPLRAAVLQRLAKCIRINTGFSCQFQLHIPAGRLPRLGKGGQANEADVFVRPFGVDQLRCLAGDVLRVGGGMLLIKQFKALLFYGHAVARRRLQPVSHHLIVKIRLVTANLVVRVLKIVHVAHQAAHDLTHDYRNRIARLQRAQYRLRRPAPYANWVRITGDNNLFHACVL